MKKENILDVIKKTKSKNDFCLKYFGYQNKRTYDIVNEYIKENNVNIDHWNKKYKCYNCKNELKKKGKFCNSSCSATYNNKKRGSHSDETKRKISESLSGKKNTYNKKLGDFYRNCEICNDEFKVKRIKNNILSRSKTCSKECGSLLRSKKAKENMNKLITEGRHQGWMSRNKISYPEKFFMKVLDNNNIKYIHNYQVKKSSLGLSNRYSYFLDFYIESKSIDLEIDGRQHLSRIEHDKKRDVLLEKNNYHVYRIKWKSINSQNGRKYIKNEIKKFIDFYNKI